MEYVVDTKLKRYVKPTLDCDSSERDIELFAIFEEYENVLKQFEELHNKVVYTHDFLVEQIESLMCGYTQCSCCSRSFPRDAVKVSYETVVYKNQLVLLDGGYGDYDTYGDKVYFETYHSCPYCGHSKLISKVYLRTENEHTRR